MKRAALAALLGAAACGPVGSTLNDSGPPPDSGCAGCDAGGPADSGQLDSGTDSGTQDAGGVDAGPSDGGSAPSWDCAVLHGTFAPNPCPAVTAVNGMATFCFRPAWPGVTGVGVWGGFGKATDWTQPFLTLTDDGSGTFTGTTAVANGSYIYLFRTTGGADGLVRSGNYNADPLNPNFAICPPGSHYYADGGDRVCSVVTVPQTPAPVMHLRGLVTYDGQPQPCWGMTFQAGYSQVPRHHEDVANFAETAADGTFDLPVTSGTYSVEVEFPFGLLDGGYPDPLAAQALGFARHSITLSSSDHTMETVDVALHGYASMAPLSGTQSLPTPFTLVQLPEAQKMALEVVTTNIAGNDPAYLSPLGTSTSVLFDGGLGGNGGSVVPGRTYWWGSWQQMATPDSGLYWTLGSLLFPIQFN